MATIYISPTGLGGTTGADAANAYAYSSLSSAETDAGPGGKILFTDGSYVLSTTTTWDGIGSSGNDITYESLNPKGAVITSDVGGSVRQLKIGDTGNTSAISVTSFKFIDVKFTIANLGPGVISLNEITSSTAIDVSYLIKSVQSTTGGTRFINNLINVERASGNYAEMFTSALAEWSGNTFHLSGASAWTGAFYFSYSSGLSFHNCAVSKNNILSTDDSSPGSHSVQTQQAYPATMNNSCFFQFDINQNASGGTGNVFTDPMYVDAANGDLRLRPNSPCINAGTAS